MDLGLQVGPLKTDFFVFYRISAQELSKSFPRAPKTAQERPRAAQDSPRASQKLTKMAMSCPGRAQDSSKTCPDPPQNQRITHDLKRTPNYTPQSFRTSFHATKRPTSKTSGGGTHPKGVFNPPDHLGESWACSGSRLESVLLRRSGF